MGDPLSRRFASFVRVLNFGMARGQQFPASSTAGQAFAALATAVAEARQHSAAMPATAGEVSDTIAAMRADIVTRLADIARVAPLVGTGTRAPGLFVVPRNRSHRTTIDTARAFLRDSEGLEPAFVTAGLPEGFRAALQTLASDLERTIASRDADKQTRAVARGGFLSAMRAAAAAMHTLDIVVPVVLRPNRGDLAEWRAIRRVMPKTASRDDDDVPAGEPPDDANDDTLTKAS